MTRLFTEGFEMQDLLAFDVNNGNTISTSIYRSGAASLSVNQWCYTTKYFSSAATMYFRFCLYLATDRANVANAFKFEWRKGTTVLGSVRNNASQNLAIYTSTGTLAATGTAILSQNTWYLIEIAVNIADSGSVQVKVNGGTKEDFTFSGDTKPGSDTAIDNINITNTCDGGGVGWYMDDFAINDTNGAADNSWCGDGHIIALTPNGNGTTNQWTGSDGNTTDNYALVDETPSNSDTDYVYDSTADHIDEYALSNMATWAAGTTISRVYVEARGKIVTADGSTMTLGIRSDDTEDFTTTAVSPNTSYSAIKSKDYTVDPDTSAAWTEAAINALQAGVKVVS